MKQRSLATLQFETTPNYNQNLSTLVTLIEQTPEESIVLAPEVCLSDFDYEHFDEAAVFWSKAIATLLPLSENRIICLTLIQKEEDNYFNVAIVIYQERIVHQQKKNRLFNLIRICFFWESWK